MTKRVKQPDEQKPLPKTKVIRRPRRNYKKMFFNCSLGIIAIQVLLLLYFRVFSKSVPPETLEMYSQNKMFVDRLMAKSELQMAIDKYYSEKRNCPPNLDILAPKYLQELVTDNLTKAPFSYRVDGDNCIIAEEGDQVELMRLKMELHGTPSPQEIASTVQVARKEIKSKIAEFEQLHKTYKGTVNDQAVNYQLECKNNEVKKEVCDFIALGEEEESPSAENTPNLPTVLDINKREPPKIRRIEADNLEMENGEASGTVRVFLVDNKEPKRELVKVTIKELEKNEEKRNYLIKIGEEETTEQELGVKLISEENGRIKVAGVLKITLE